MIKTKILISGIVYREKYLELPNSDNIFNYQYYVKWIVITEIIHVCFEVLFVHVRNCNVNILLYNMYVKYLNLFLHNLLVRFFVGKL